jgi:hypothetical protein
VKIAAERARQLTSARHLQPHGPSFECAFSLPLASRGRKAAAQNADKSFFVIVLGD